MLFFSLWSGILLALIRFPRSGMYLAPIYQSIWITCTNHSVWVLFHQVSFPSREPAFHYVF